MSLHTLHLMHLNAELTLNFILGQDKDKVSKMLCKGAKLHFLPPRPPTPTATPPPSPGYEITLPPPLPLFEHRKLKSMGRPPNLPLPELPERWANHCGLIKNSHGSYQGYGRHGMGSKFMFNCNNGGVVHDYHYTGHNGINGNNGITRSSAISGNHAINRSNAITGNNAMNRSNAINGSISVSRSNAINGNNLLMRSSAMNGSNGITNGSNAINGNNLLMRSTAMNGSNGSTNGSNGITNGSNGITRRNYRHYESMEQSICQVFASVMLYDDSRRQWLPSGGTLGMARVHIYHHQSNNQYRVVGRLMSDQSVVINCAILKGLKYNQATATFHQWRDSRQVYGLNFQSADDAEKFARSMMESLDALQAPPRPSPPAPPVQQPPVHQQNHQNGPDLRHDVHNSMQQQSAPPSQPPVPEPQAAVPRPPPGPPGPPAPPAAPAPPPVPTTGPPQPPSPQNSAPPAPPGAPPAPPGPPGPPAPPGPPGGAGGPPPPPPPPPPPGPGGAGGGGGSGGGNDLAAQLAAAKLKKATPKPDNGDDPPPNRPKGGPTGINMMADLQRKLKLRKEKAEGGDGSSSPPTTNAASNNRISPPDKTSNPVPKNTTKPWEKKITNGAVAGSASPRTQRKSNSRENGSGDNVDFDRMKQEIMVEMRKEINKMKEDIIEAIKMELNRR